MRDFEQQWENNRKRLHGLLVYLVKDIDLADDLLQEAYLRAGQKIESYRGGNFGAWLAAIAKSAAFTHLRRAYVKGESPLGEGFDAVHEDAGTESHLEAVLVRGAVDGLSPALRNALILKHYGGFNYPEIAARLNCPVGTAKRRVWTAIRQLRAALGTIREEIAMEKCAGLALLDYAYGTLPENERASVEAHVGTCGACKTQLEDIRGVVASLQAARDELVFVDITDILADGSSITYSSSRPTNARDEPLLGYGFDSTRRHTFQSFFVDGEEASFDARDDSKDPEYRFYTVHLKRPLPPGETATCLGIFTTPEGIGASLDIGFGRRIAVPDNSGTDTSDHLLVQMVRLPEGAELIGSVPVADEVRTSTRTTLVWRRLVPAGEIRERPVVVYSA